MKNIRRATTDDLSRIAEIEVFNYRMNFYPIFKNDDYYFNELQVYKMVEEYKCSVENMWVYDDGAVKGFVQIENSEVKKLFVEPILHGNSIGSKLLEFVVCEYDTKFLWALAKNTKAIKFYQRNGFHITSEKKFEDDTTEYLIRLER